MQKRGEKNRRSPNNGKASSFVVQTSTVTSLRCGGGHGHSVSSDLADDKMRKLWKFFGKKPILVTFIVTVCAFSYALNEVNKATTLARKTATFAKSLAEQREMDTILGSRANCEAINVSTDKLRKIVVVATSGNIGIDYTAIPEFKGLSPSSKEFFLALRIRSTTVGNVQAREEFLKGLDVRDCKMEYPFPPPRPKKE